MSQSEAFLASSSVILNPTAAPCHSFADGTKHQNYRTFQLKSNNFGTSLKAANLGAVPRKLGKESSKSRDSATFACAVALGFSFCSQQKRSLAALKAHPRQRLLDSLSVAIRELEAMIGAWTEMPVEPSSFERLGELQHREQIIRQSLQSSEFGSPGDMYAIPQRPSSDVVVTAYCRAAKALIDLELAQKHWETQFAEAMGEHLPGSPDAGSFASRLLNMAVLRIRLFEHDLAYSLLQRALPMLLGSQQWSGAEGLQAKAWLTNLAKNTAMSQVLRKPGSMDAKFLTERSIELLPGLKDIFLKSGYSITSVLDITKVSSIEVFCSDDVVDQVAAHITEPTEPSALRAFRLIQFFLLNRLIPLQELRELIGRDCCELLLQMQAMSAVRGDCCELIAPEEAVEADDALCFANIKLWPVEEDLIIATDRQTWPCKDFEPVMYLSDDSWGLIHAAPRSPVGTVLDLCTGSGVQGIVALRYYATKAHFVDINPRALNFVQFNAALNGLSHKVAGVHLGNLYEALPAGTAPFDAILANPPFLPNPRGIASQCTARFGDGGDFGEDVLETIIKGATTMLKSDGHLSAVTYAPNVHDMPARIERYFTAGADGPKNYDITVYTDEPKPAEQFKPVSSAVELKCYQEALEDIGVTTMAEAITFLNFTSQGPKARWVKRKELFQDRDFLRSLWEDEAQ